MIGAVVRKCETHAGDCVGMLLSGLVLMAGERSVGDGVLFAVGTTLILAGLVFSFLAFGYRSS